MDNSIANTGRTAPIAEPTWVKEYTYYENNSAIVQNVIDKVALTDPMVIFLRDNVNVSQQLVIRAGQTIKLSSELKFSIKALSGNKTNRVITIERGGTLFLEYLRVERGIADYGGGIYNSGTLVLNNSGWVTLCNAEKYGGGIYNSGNGSILQMTNGEIYQCESRQNGGGVYAAQGSAVLLYGDAMITSCASVNGIGGAIYTPRGNLRNIEVGTNCRLYANAAARGNNYVTPQDMVIYNANVKNSVFSSPYTNAYNNYDISYGFAFQAYKRGVNKPLTDGQFSFGAYLQAYSER